MRVPPDAANLDFDDWQLKTRFKTAEGIASMEIKTFPAVLRQVYERFPTWKLYRDHKNRPVRLFGAMNYNSSGTPHMHSITLHKDGKSFFTLGGTPADTLTTVAHWDPASVSIIRKSLIPGVFLDPLGHELASKLGSDTGYDVLSGNLCSCCCHKGQRLPTDRPVLLGPEHLRAMTERCAECRELKRSHLCGRCKKVRYCSPECQAKAWPTHKQHCKASC